MSKPIVITIPHALGAAEARRRIEEGFGKLASQVPGGGLADVQQTWKDNRLVFSAKAVGQVITGAMDVMADSVRMELVLPGLLGMLANKIQGHLQKQGALLLEKK